MKVKDLITLLREIPGSYTLEKNSTKKNLGALKVVLVSMDPEKKIAFIECKNNPKKYMSGYRAKDPTTKLKRGPKPKLEENNK